MRNKLLYTLITLCLVAVLNAGDYRVGTGTSTQNKVPMYGYNNYGWSKFFYTADEMIAAGVTGTIDITKIAFQVSSSTTNYVMDNQQVYMRQFYDTSYASSAVSYPGTSGFTHVYSGSVTWNGPGWVEIAFQTPFNYNSTWGLEILWENRDGSKIGGPPYFYYTSLSNSAVYKSQDTSFPTVSGTRASYHPNIWFMTPATEEPTPAVAVNPVDGATDVDISTALHWNHTGGDPDDYLFSMWTQDPLVWIASNMVTTATSYTPVTRLDYGKTYYWRVIPRNEFGQALGCPNWSFTTLSDPAVTTFPWTEDFDSGTFPPNDNWQRYGGDLVDPIVLGGSSIWAQDDWLNISGTDKCAKVNVWGSVNGWLVSPLLNVTDDSYYLSFDLALLKYNQPPTGTPPALTGTDDRFAVLIGDGFGWTTANIVREWNNTGSPYVLNDISIWGEKVNIPLSGHTGHIRIAFFGGSTISNADNDFMINNLYVGAYLPEPVVSISNDPVHGTCTLSWTAIDGATSYSVYSSAAPDGTWNLLDSTSSTQYQITPTLTKAFFHVKAINNR
jgi:hypothetical protein